MATENKPKLHPEKIEILDFNLLSGEIHSPESFDLKNVIKHDFAVDLKLGLNLEEKLIKATISLEVQTNSEGRNKEEANSKFLFSFLYGYEDLQELVITEENNRTVLHHQMENAISAITYSTSRGILMTRYQGTAFKDFILPVVNPDNLLDDQ